MRQRTLGATGLRVSELGLGCSSIGGGVFERDDAAARRLLERAFELGIDFFDTADGYGFGRSEALLGEVFQGRRDRVVFATKGGQLATTLGRYAKVVDPWIGRLRPLLRPIRGPLRRRSHHRQDFRPEHLGGALEKSLRRLRTDCIDLYQLHSPAGGVLETGDVFEALERFRSQGKIKHYGVSIARVEDGLLCLQAPGLAALQVAFNLIETEAARELLPRAAERGIGIVVKVPLGRGLLTERGAVGTGLHVGDPALAERAASARRQLGFLWEDGRRTLPETALRFVLDHPQVSTVIPGTTSLRHLEANVRALDSPPLTVDERAAIQALLPGPAA